MKKKGANQFVLDKKEIPSDKNAYVFRNPTNNNRWYLYFYDRHAEKRHRLVLKDQNGSYPRPIPEAQDEAFVLGIAKFVELKGKSDRGEAINQLTWGELCRKFLQKEKRKISNIPHNGITKTRYRLLDNQVRWLRDFMNNDKKAIHKITRTTFLSYESWRKERALELNKKIPQATTINQELSTLKRIFTEVAVAHGYLTHATVPEIPRVRLPKDKSHRREDLTEQEWLEIEKVTRLYFIKGRTRLLDKNYTIEKGKNGQYKTITEVTGQSIRGRNQLTHRILFYWGMRISMDTGIRIGSLKQLRWKNISPNTTLPKDQQKLWVSIDVPAESTKTGRSYRCAAPIAKHLEAIRKVTIFKKPNDLIFINQLRGTPFTERIWVEYWKEVLVQARLADWSEDDIGRGHGCRKIKILSGKKISWYSLRHTHITMALNRGVPVPTLAANTDTSMKYIEEHYFHYRADAATEILSKGREKRLKPSRQDLSWINAVETEARSR